jgi:predicted ATP-binding protein involved in virulence
VKLKTLTVKNFRGLADLTLDFHPRLTVLVGENGIGKTSILDALAILLDQYVARFVRARAQTAMQVKESDLHRSLNLPHPITTTIKLRTEVGTEGVTWSVTAQNREARLQQATSSELTNLNDYVQQKVQGKGTSLEGEPLFIYFGQGRVIIDSVRRIRRQAPFGMIDAFQDGLSSNRSAFRDFVAWFRDEDHLSLQSRGQSKQMKAVIDAFKAITDFFDIKYLIGTNINGVYVVKSDQDNAIDNKKKQTISRGYNNTNSSISVDLRFEQLSSGEQALSFLAADLARRLVMLNPDLANPLEGEGIVLIDEIELHLHPGWQRVVLPRLLETFPNCQFVVTTHSPQVLGEVKAESIRILRADEDGRITVYGTEASYGRDSNFLLLSVLGAEDQNIETKSELDTLGQEIMDNKLDVAEGHLADLRTRIEGSPPELDIAQARIERRRRRAAE